MVSELRLAATLPLPIAQYNRMMLSAADEIERLLLILDWLEDDALPDVMFDMAGDVSKASRIRINGVDFVKKP